MVRDSFLLNSLRVWYTNTSMLYNNLQNTWSFCILGINNNPKTVEGILHSLVRRVEQKIEKYKQLVSNDTDYIPRWKELQMYTNGTASPHSSSPGIRLFFNLDIVMHPNLHIRSYFWNDSSYFGSLQIKNIPSKEALKMQFNVNLIIK